LFSFNANIGSEFLAEFGWNVGYQQYLNDVLVELR